MFLSSGRKMNLPTGLLASRVMRKLFSSAKIFWTTSKPMKGDMKALKPLKMKVVQNPHQKMMGKMKTNFKLMEKALLKLLIVKNQKAKGMTQKK